MLELFGVIVVWATVAMTGLGSLLLLIVSTGFPHFLLARDKKNAVERNTPARR